MWNSLESNRLGRINLHLMDSIKIVQIRPECVPHPIMETPRAHLFDRLWTSRTDRSYLERPLGSLGRILSLAYKSAALTATVFAGRGSSSCCT
jgi:hypothetical protein